MWKPHVRVETRKVYISARGAKLTSHGAYQAAGKALIAEACDCYRRCDCECYAECPCNKSYICRFHVKSEVVQTSPEDAEGGRMEHWDRVYPRLVRFLKFVDKRTLELSRHIIGHGAASRCHDCAAVNGMLTRYTWHNRKAGAE